MKYLFLSLILSSFLNKLKNCSLLKLELNILLESSLPFCLFPIFIVKVFNEGASIIPLDEFPIITFEKFKIDKKSTFPKESLNKKLFFFEKSFSFFEILTPPRSMLDPEKMKE